MRREQEEGMSEEGGRDKHVNKAVQDARREGKYRLKNVQTSVVTDMEEVD